ncbi:MAG TPA: extracellular solute-binding protein [Anaerolineales bacterium]|jgi:spermidine/putrescine transport system substrate-binding protein
MALQKRSLLIITGMLVIMSILLVGCGPQATEEPTQAAPQPPAATEMPPAATTPPDTQVPPTIAAPVDTTGSLTVLDWAGYDTPDFWTDFQSKYPKVNVGFEFGASDGDIYSKMKAGDQADIFHPYTGWLQLYVDQGLVEEIDTSKLTNWDKVPENFKKIGQINGKQYFIPWDWGFTSILYRTDKIPGGIDSWAALQDPKYKGHISMWDDGPGAVAVSAYIHGWGDETKITPDQLAQIKQEWIAQRKLNLFYWNAEPDLQQAMEKGDVWVAYAWQGSYATLLGKGVPVAYAHPKEGWNSWVGVYGIRKGSPNYDLALKFLDEKLAQKTGENLVNEYYYGDSNQDVMQGVTDPTLKQAFSLEDPNILQKTNFTPNLTTQQIDDWNAMWSEVKAAP